MYRALKSGVQVVAAKVFQEQDPNSSGSLLSSSRASAARTDVFKQEIAILKSCHDRNIVQFIGACLQPDCTIMVMEYLEGGDLYHAIANDSTGRFSWYRRYALMRPLVFFPLISTSLTVDVKVRLQRMLHLLECIPCVPRLVSTTIISPACIESLQS